MAFLFMMVGISGSGKSTNAKKIQENLRAEGSEAVIISTDQIRGELCNGNQSDQSKNTLVFETAFSRVDEALASGLDTIYDATNLSREDRVKPIAIGRKHNAPVIAVTMCVPLTVAIERNRARDRVVPSPVIWKQQGKFYPPGVPEFDQVVNVSLDVEWPHWKPLKKSAQRSQVD